MKLRTIFLLFLLSVLLLPPQGAKAQDVVDYENIKISGWTTTLLLGLSRQEEGYVLTLSYTSAQRKLLPKSTLWLRTFDDNVVQLSGTLVDNEVRLSNQDEGATGLPKRVVVATAVYLITRGQLEQLSHGVKHLRSSTIPTTLDYVFSRDRIGQKLYQLFLHQEEVF